MRKARLEGVSESGEIHVACVLYMRAKDFGLYSTTVELVAAR